MKKLWQILLAVGAVILGIFAMSAGSGNKKQFKKDLKDNKDKLKDNKRKSEKLKKEKKVIKKKITKTKAKIKETKKKINEVDSTNARKTISSFEKKYRSKK